MREICWKLTIETPEQCQWRHMVFIIVNFEQIHMIWFWCFLCCFEQINAGQSYLSDINRKGTIVRSSRPEVFLRNVVLKICSKFSVISMKLYCNFIEIALGHGCSLANMLYIFKIPFLKNTSGRLLLYSFMRHSDC